MVDYLQRIDRETLGRRCDVTPLFGDYAALVALGRNLSHPFLGIDIDYVVGIDALGFILGVLVAQELQIGFIPMRKGGKLPVAVDSVSFVDYSNERKSLELRKDALCAGQRVLLVDEWIETGSQVNAAVQLIEGRGAQCIGIAAIHIDDNPATQALRDKYFCHSLQVDG